MSAASPAVSVVTPFYNTAAELAECIESVLAQSYRDFEYILVDNQSSDGSGAIAERYAKQDRRIRLLRTPQFFNQVQNYNYAVGQIAAGSRFCKVVQADDALMPRCLEAMVATADAHPRVAIVSSYRLHGDVVDGSGLPRERVVMSGRDACRLFLVDEIYLFGSPTTLLFRADVVRARRPFWAEGRLHEDTEAVFEILGEHDFAFVHEVLTFSRLAPQSIMGRASSFAPFWLDKLILYRRFGARDLDADELRRCEGEHRAAYNRFLFKAWLARRGSDFWDFQRKGLAMIGETLNPLAIARAGLPVVADTVLPPALTAFLRRATKGGG